MNGTAQQMQNYLETLLHDPAAAFLDFGKLPAEFRQTGELLLTLQSQILEQMNMVENLVQGSLDTPVPSQSNEMAAPLKSLHAGLRHLTWCARQVAKGDYKQRIEFMGEFSNSFNTMIEQLEQRQTALEQEVRLNEERALALEQSLRLFEVLTNSVPQLIIVQDLHTKQPLHYNIPAAQTFRADTQLERALTAWLGSFDPLEKVTAGANKKPYVREFKYQSAYGMRWFLSSAYPLNWQGNNAVVYLFTEVTEEKRQVQQLESYAYRDSVTHLYNRLYGMRILEQWVAEKRSFCVCFVDIDHLKYVNDQFGHREGDRYIQTVANVLREHLPTALAARYGGDEFIVLVPNISEADLDTHMGKICISLIKSCMVHKSPFVYSFSFGIVEVGPDNLDAPNKLLSIADERMYACKRLQNESRARMGWGVPG